MITISWWFFVWNIFLGVVLGIHIYRLIEDIRKLKKRNKHIKRGTK